MRSASCPGYLLVIAAFGAVTTKAAFRILLVVAGVAGAAAGEIGRVVRRRRIGARARREPRGSAECQLSGWPARSLALALAGVVVFGVVQLVRPEVTPGSADFRSSSASQRIVLGAAGLEIFERNPVIGVGWRQSSSPGRDRRS